MRFTVWHVMPFWILWLLSFFLYYYIIHLLECNDKFFLWQSLKFLISLIMIWLQMLLILTKSVNRCFEKNPKFDMTPLLGGTDVVFSSLIHSFSWFVSLFPFGFWNAFVLTPAYLGGTNLWASFSSETKTINILQK